MKLLVSKNKTHDIVGHIPDFLTEEECDSLHEINKNMQWKYCLLYTSDAADE